MNTGLKESATNRITGVLVRHPQIKKAVLYGSRAMGTYKTGSDIDLTLMGESDLTDEVLRSVMDELDDLLPYTFDLSIFKDIHDPEVTAHIDRVGISIYERAVGGE